MLAVSSGRIILMKLEIGRQNNFKRRAHLVVLTSLRRSPAREGGGGGGEKKSGGVKKKKGGKIFFGGGGGVGGGGGGGASVSFKEGSRIFKQRAPNVTCSELTAPRGEYAALRRAKSAFVFAVKIGRAH